MMDNKWLIDEARKQAKELAKNGVNGTPNLLVDLANALEIKEAHVSVEPECIHHDCPICLQIRETRRIMMAKGE